MKKNDTLTEKEWYTDWAGPSIKQRFYHVGFRPFDFGSDNIVTLKRKCFLFFLLFAIVGLLVVQWKETVIFLRALRPPPGEKGPLMHSQTK